PISTLFPYTTLFRSASAEEGSLVFAESAASLEEALSSKAAAVITGEFAREKKANKPLIICKQPKYAFSKAASILESLNTVEGIRSEEHTSELQSLRH